MNAQITPLNDAQRMFAHQNHHLVTTYLRLRHLSMAEFYDVLIFQFLRVVQLYLSNAQLQEYDFSAIADHAMDWAVKDHRRRCSRKTIRMISLDCCYGGEQLTLYEYLPANDPDVCDQVADELMAERLLAKLTEEQRNILHLRLHGYSVSEMAHKTGLQKSQIKQTFDEIQSVVMASY